MNLVNKIEGWVRDVAAGLEPDIAAIRAEAENDLNDLKAAGMAEFQKLKEQAMTEVEAHGPQVKAWLQQLLVEAEKAIAAALTKH